MKRFKNILLLTHDVRDLEVTLPRAAALAEDNGAWLTIVKVEREIPDGVEEIYAAMHLADMGDLGELVAKERALMIRERVVEVADGRVPLEVDVRFGIPFLEVVRMVLQDGHDLVITTAEEAEGDGVLGGTAMSLMRKCPCPVWLLRPERRPSYGRVLAAVKLEHETDLDLSVNDAVLELASSLASSERARLHVVLAWSIYGERVLRCRGRLSEDDRQRLNQDVCWQRRVLLDRFLARHELQLGDDRVHLIKGRPGPVITELAERQNMDIIVMGTVANSGVKGLLMGNTAEWVLQRVSCSVMAVKPSNFVSPVKRS